jgi:phosphopantothenoylcysteine decarboxylase/phosphopantothenate--cysteine ligase
MRVALGVAGGIAAYKAAELARLLQESGAEVQVVMTRAAREFVAPLTFAALTGQKVITEMFRDEGAEPNLEAAIEHIAVARGIDALLVAPATADVLARMAHGLANDFLTTLFLATQAPVFVAPAMNVNMWQHPATRANMELLRARGVRVIEPREGYLACGMTGPGRMAEPAQIVETLIRALEAHPDLKQESVLVTAGPTEEPLDPVRFISNRSSGRMGFAVAEAARDRGAQVTLISGPVQITPPAGVQLVKVRTAQEMHRAVIEHLPSSTLLVMAAAVADFQADEISHEKIKKHAGVQHLTLRPTPDILAEVARRRRNSQLIVGFAAETTGLLRNAADKMKAKKLDLMVANDVTQQGAGFDVETNIVTLLFPDGRTETLPKLSKHEVALRLLDAIVALRQRGKDTAAGSA